MKVAIDGPAGSGKSTIARLVAGALSFIHLDSGAIYRGIAFACMERFFPEDFRSSDRLPDVDEERVGAFLEELKLEPVIREGQQKIFLEGRDISEEIRENKISIVTPYFSSMPVVRKKVNELLRKIAGSLDVVMEGRDIGTVVFPDAEVKIYLNASIEERAKRRQLELEKKGEKVSFESLLEEVRARDEKDMKRPVAPLKKAEDAVEIDTTGLSIEEVVALVSRIVNERRISGGNL